MSDSDRGFTRKGGKLEPNGPPFVPPEIIPEIDALVIGKL